MLYTVTLDKDNYILSIGNSLNDNVELDLSKIDLRFLNAYQLIDGQAVANEEKMAELVAEEEQKEKNEEIEDLEQKLYSTDYIMARMLEEIMALNNPLTFIADMIKIFASYATKYKNTLADRKAWRERIEELKK